MHCCCVTKSCCLNWWSSYFQYVNSWCFSPFQPYCFNKGISHWLHTYSHNIMISILCHIVIFIKIAFAPKQSMNCSPWSTFFFGQNDILRQIARQNVKDSGLKVEMRDPHIFFKDTISLLLKEDSQYAQLIVSGMPLRLPSYRCIKTEQYSFAGLEGPMISMLELRSKNPPNSVLVKCT